MRKRIIVGMLAIFSLTLPSCDDHDPTVSSNPSKPESVDVDPRVRPSDWALDYWVGDVIEHKDLNERNLYYPLEVFICYMDSAYSDNIGQDGTVDYEKKRVNYRLYPQDESFVVSSIYVNDPDVDVYGLSMCSSKERINNVFLGMNFEYDDSYSGFDPCYRKDGIEFRIYHHYASIEDFGIS